MPAVAIRTDHLRRDFGDLCALHDVCLEVPMGTVTGFLGPNGAGKTTMIRLLLGLIEPSAGSAEVMGFDTQRRSDEVRARSGTLLEHTGLYERLNAVENLDFYGRIYRLSAADRRLRIRDVLSRFGLWDRRTERVSRWSRGMRKRLAIARALIHRPPVVFLDEPTTGLDARSAALLRQDVRKMVEAEGVSVFLATHNLAEAEQLCDQVAILDRGRLLAAGSPADLRENGSAPRIEIIGRGFTQEVLHMVGTRSEVRATSIVGRRLHIDLHEDVDTAPVVSAVVGAGAEIEEVKKRWPSLEETLLELTEARP